MSGAAGSAATPGWFTALLLGGSAIRSGADATGMTFAKPLIYAAIWTAYLLRSTRVANTYPATAEADRLAAVFD